MTRLERLPNIIRYGLLPDAEVPHHGMHGPEIGYRHIKAQRARRRVPCGAEGSLADYVPFYFAPRSPMLYAITRGNVSREAAQTEEIVYLCSSTQALRAAGLTVVVSNRHAVLQYAELTDADEDLNGEAFVDWPLMTATYWNDTLDDPDRKERRQAECLAHPAVAWELVEEVVTKTTDAAQEVLACLQAQGQTTPVTVRRGWYF